MTKKRFSQASLAIVAFLLAVLLCSGCSSEKDKVTSAVTQAMESYSAVSADDSGDAKKDADEEAAEPAYGDDATAERLEGYGAGVEDYHEHCFKSYSFEVGEAKLDGDSATVQVRVTNQSLQAAADAAAADYDAWDDTDEAQAAYADLGHQSLFQKLLEFLYARLDANESPVTTDIEVSLSKGEDGTWSLNRTPEFYAALYGGTSVE